MLTNLFAMDWYRKVFAIVDRDELLVFDRKSLEPVWQRNFPAKIVGLHSINDGLIMVLDERGEISQWDWHSGEANGGLSIGIHATGSSATFHGFVAVSTESSVVVVFDCQIVTAIPIQDLAALMWSDNGESLAIGNEKGELFIYQRTDLHQLRDPKPMATMLFEKRISAIAWGDWDRDSGVDYWDVVVGDSIWSVAPITGFRKLYLQGLPTDIHQFTNDRDMYVVAFQSRVFVYLAFSLTVVERTITEIHTNLAVPNDRSKLVIADIDYGDRIVTGLQLDYYHQLLVGLDQGEANLVNLVEENLYRTDPFPGHRAINLEFNAEFHSGNIRGLRRLPEIDVNAEPKPTPAERKKQKSVRRLTEARFRWWTAPFAGIAMGGIIGVHLSGRAPQSIAIPLVLICITIGLVAGLLVCIFDFFRDGE